MESNFQKVHVSRDWCRGDLGPRRGHIVEGQHLLESGNRKLMLLGVVVEHMLHDADVVLHYNFILHATYGYLGRLASLSHTIRVPDSSIIS